MIRGGNQMKKKSKVIKSASKKKQVNEYSVEDFWTKWINMGELEQEKYMMKLVPIIQRHWQALDMVTMKEQLGPDERLRLQAAFLNSYFLDLLRTLVKEVG